MNNKTMKILLATDGSPCSACVAAEIARLPLPAETIVQVVTVDVPPEVPILRGTLTVFDEFVQQQRAETARRLDETVGKLKALAPNLTIVPKLLQGYPKDVIIAEAEQWGANLIVVGSHGYGPIRRFFLGSVSLFVAHNAPCSVLIARCKPDTCLVSAAPPQA